MHPTLNIAVKAARRAGQIINRASMDVDKLRIDVKQQSDYVTEVDRAAEAAILDVLRRGWPAPAPTANTSGSSIRSTAPPTSSTACRNMPFRSAWRTRA
jgi:myo-inositol-1(or 4)-monophosphatase